jgi:serine/threonine protein phosphatase PrpC
MNYSIIQDSRIGGREINQDRAAWLATESTVLMVVADGMGGHLQGEVAAQIAIDTLIERFRAKPGPPGRPGAVPRDALRQAHRASSATPPPAASRPRRAAHHLHRLCGAGRPGKLGACRRFAPVPGSPASGRGEPTASHTRDHSVVQRMVDDGSISPPKQAAIHPLRNRVFSCLGGATRRRRSRFPIRFRCRTAT